MATPKSITGGCLCTSLRYKITFPPDYNFTKNSNICQCTQCRKQTGSLFYMGNTVPASAFEWTSDTTTLKRYSATKGINRSFCGKCGSYLTWWPEGRDSLSVPVGSVDALYLFGEGFGMEGEEGRGVPEGGYGKVLCAGGEVEWCANEVKGVTDTMELLNRGKRHLGDAGASG